MQSTAKVTTFDLPHSLIRLAMQKARARSCATGFEEKLCLSFGLGFEYFATAVKASGADVVAQMHLASGGL
jgi:hypothetical protein